MSHVPLAAAIEALRTELEDAIVGGEGRAVRFEAASIDLELQATVTTAGKAKAGIKWWLVEAGGEASLDKKAVQTVRLSLTPVVEAEPGVDPQPVLLDGDD